MSEITAAGYTRLRTGSPISDWWVEFRDDQGDPVVWDDLEEGTTTRLSASDERVTVTDNPTTQTVTFAAVLTGEHLDGGLPRQVHAAVLYGEPSGGPALTEVEPFEVDGSPAPFVFGDPSDEATLRHHVEAPEQGE